MDSPDPCKPHYRLTVALGGEGEVEVVSAEDDRVHHNSVVIVVTPTPRPKIQWRTLHLLPSHKHLLMPRPSRLQPQNLLLFLPPQPSPPTTPTIPNLLHHQPSPSSVFTPSL